MSKQPTISSHRCDEWVLPSMKMISIWLNLINILYAWYWSAGQYNYICCCVDTILVTHIIIMCTDSSKVYVCTRIKITWLWCHLCVSIWSSSYHSTSPSQPMQGMYTAYSGQCNIYQIRYYWPPCLRGIELVIHCHCLPSKCLLHSKHHSKTTLLQSCELGSYLVVHISLSSWRHMSSKRLLKIYDWLIVHTTNVIYTLLVWLTHSK